MTGIQGRQPKLLPENHDIASWALARASKAIKKLPATHRSFFSEARYVLLAEFCAWGERVWTEEVSPEQREKYFCELGASLQAEFGLTVEFMRLVRDQWGIEHGFKKNQRWLAAKKAKRASASPAAVSLAWRYPSAKSAIARREKAEGPLKDDAKAAVFSGLLKRPVPTDSVKKARKQAREEAKRR